MVLYGFVKMTFCADDNLRGTLFSDGILYLKTGFLFENESTSKFQLGKCHEPFTAS